MSDRPDLAALADRLDRIGSSGGWHSLPLVDEPCRRVWMARSELDQLRTAARILRAVAAALPALLDIHQPEWVSEEAKAAGKDPWVCRFCGTADGSWPCSTRLELDTMADAVGEP